MTRAERAARCLALAVLTIIGGGVLSSVANAQEAPADTSTTALIRQMAGTWNVEQRMWPAAGAKAVDLPAAIARRRVVEGAFLEEVMEAARKAGQESFTRTSYFLYNTVTRGYEYFSVDSRLPQMMNERSDSTGPREPGAKGISLQGGRFVAPRWGDARNVAFTYRLTMGKVEGDRQVVHLYLTPQSGAAREFLAFEYVYTRGR